MRANQLGLKGEALKAAQAFERAFPEAVFTSGNRSTADQARAMAQNAAQDRGYIKETYAKPLCLVARALQSWLDKNPTLTSVEDLRNGFLAILLTFSDSELHKLSSHLSGGAFDVQPDDDEAKDTFLENEAKQRGGKFIRREGKLKRRHWQA